MLLLGELVYEIANEFWTKKKRRGKKGTGNESVERDSFIHKKNYNTKLVCLLCFVEMLTNTEIEKLIKDTAGMEYILR